MQLTVSKKMLNMFAKSGQLEEFIKGMEAFSDVSSLRAYQKEFEEKKEKKKKKIYTLKLSNPGIRASFERSSYKLFNLTDLIIASKV